MASRSQESKQEQVYSVLRRGILDGTYPPGYRLVIDTIRRELQVSPMPVREAIRRLEAEGWIEYRPHSGAQVALPDEHAWEEAVEALAVLEGYVTARAAPHLRRADLTRLRAINDEMSEDLDAADIISFNRRNEDWHRVIWDRCPNRMLRREVDTVQERLNVHRESLWLPIAAGGRAAIEEHTTLIGMLEAGATPEEIERFARTHKLTMIQARNDRRDGRPRRG